MTLQQLVARSQHLVKSNSTTILSAFAVSGLAGTAYLSGRASWISAQVVELEEEKHQVLLTNKEKFRLVGKNYIPTVLTGALTIGCIIGAQRVGSKRAATAQAAFALSERAFSEYREKVVEHIGAGKEQKIRDEVKQDKVNANPPTVIVDGSGVLCMESHTGRYFVSDMETLRKSQNDINALMYSGYQTTLDELYNRLGLESTAHSSTTGWEADKPLALEFTTCLHEGKPVLVFSYNYIKAL